MHNAVDTALAAHLRTMWALGDYPPPADTALARRRSRVGREVTPPLPQAGSPSGRAPDVTGGTVTVADDDGDEPSPQREGAAGGFTPPAKHVGADRAAVRSLREAQRISEVLGGMGVAEEPVVVDRRGPQHSIAALDRMLAEALAEDERADRGDDAPP